MYLKNMISHKFFIKSFRFKNNFFNELLDTFRLDAAW